MARRPPARAAAAAGQGRGRYWATKTSSSRPPSAKCSSVAFCPAAVLVLDGEELDLREGVGVRGHDGLVVHAVAEADDDLLGLRGCRGSRDRPRPSPGCRGRRRPCRRPTTGNSASRLTGGTTGWTLSAPYCLRDGGKLGLEGDEHVADAALGEGRGRGAPAGVEDRHVGEDLARGTRSPSLRRRRTPGSPRRGRRDRCSGRCRRSWGSGRRPARRRGRGRPSSSMSFGLPARTTKAGSE